MIEPNYCPSKNNQKLDSAYPENSFFLEVKTFECAFTALSLNHDWILILFSYRYGLAQCD